MFNCVVGLSFRKFLTVFGSKLVVNCSRRHVLHFLIGFCFRKSICIPISFYIIDRILRRFWRELFTLLWTPESDENYKSQYQDWRPVVKSEILPSTVSIQRVKKDISRKRLRFQLKGGGIVEVKLGDKLDRSMQPCSSCNHQLVCEEKFGDYVRVDPALGMYFCYLRRDIGFSVSNYLDENTGFKKTLQGSIGGIDGSEMLSQTSLRLTVVPFCNFNCRTPGQTHGWCMEEPGEYRYPPIKPTLIQLKR